MRGQHQEKARAPFKEWAADWWDIDLDGQLSD